MIGFDANLHTYYVHGKNSNEFAVKDYEMSCHTAQYARICLEFLSVWEILIELQA